MNLNQIGSHLGLATSTAWAWYFWYAYGPEMRDYLGRGEDSIRMYSEGWTEGQVIVYYLAAISTLVCVNIFGHNAIFNYFSRR